MVDDRRAHGATSSLRALGCLATLAAALGCSAAGSATARGGGTGGSNEAGAGGLDGASSDVGAADGGATETDASPLPAGLDCSATSTDLYGCACTPPATKGCWPGDVNPANRNVGVCRDGTQACEASGEIREFGRCLGAVVPRAEDCANHDDDDCNGASDCDDPACATDPACGGGCADGDTRPCYDGPAGTVGVGTCRAGTQTCTGGTWPTTCDGETLPAAEVCTDTLDHNCNGFRGCDDAFACLLSSSCWGTCSAPDPGCTCPVGTGDLALCPNGTFGKVKSFGFGTGKPPEVECCPCGAGDCGNLGCCGESVCAGSQFCAGLTCEPLPPSCGGQVNFDCDFEDWDPNDSSRIAEDCDQACCKCKPSCL